MVISWERYQQLIGAAEVRVKGCFLEAQKDVYESTAEITEDEIEELVAESVRESRTQRAGTNEL